MAYTFYEDPGHGWLKVPMEELKTLGIMGKISCYSYRSHDGKTAFLEEDCDAAVFLDAMKAAGKKVTIKSKYVHRFGGYPHFS